MKIAVAGLGLIGGSFYKASLAAGYETVGLHHNDGPEALADADLVIVAQPPEAIVPWIRSRATAFKKGAVVLDICGIKQDIARAMEEVQQDGWTFVGGHPMAGREVSGYENSLATLFVGASMIITPKDGTPVEIIDRLKEYFNAIGFRMTVVTDPKRHDEMIAFTSQLCHIIATTYARDERVKEAIGFSAGSYADMTRIATQNADDWSALYSSNREALLTVLDDFLARFTDFRNAVVADDLPAVKRMIIEGTEAKKHEIAIRKRGDAVFS